MSDKSLLVTVTKIEATSALEISSKATNYEAGKKSIHNKTYDLGNIGKSEIYMVQSEMGISGLGASLCHL